MNNHNEQEPLNGDNQISEAIEYWGNAPRDRSLVTVKNIEHMQHVRTWKRIGLSCVCVFVAVASVLSLPKRIKNESNVQIAKSQRLPQEAPTGVPELDDSQLQRSIKQLRADRDALNSQLADLERSRIQSRIDRSFAIADQAHQWVSQQQNDSHIP